MPPLSSKLPPDLRVAIGGKRRPRVDRAHELFARCTTSLSEIKRIIASEFNVSPDSAKDDVIDMLHELQATRYEQRPFEKTIALSNLEAVMLEAMRDRKFSAAVRAMELHAKITGVLQAQEQGETAKPRLDFSLLPAERREAFRQDLDTIAQGQIAAARAGTAQA